MAGKLASGFLDDRIVILPVSLLDTSSGLVAEFRSISKHLGLNSGWHYLLDLAWAAERLIAADVHHGSILDAGAGVGLMQWWLASHGAEVISVDRTRRHFSQRMRKWTSIGGDSEPLPSLRASALDRIRNREGAANWRWMGRVPGALRDVVVGDPATSGPGHVLVAQADLQDLGFIESGSIDAVVSISSLEHNTLDALPHVIAELLRVLRPGVQSCRNRRSIQGSRLVPRAIPRLVFHRTNAPGSL